METTHKPKTENVAKESSATQTGKAMTVKDHIKHGIFAGLKTKFDLVSYDEVFRQFAEEFGPSTPSRRVAIEQLALTYIRLLRCAQFEAFKLNESLDPPEYKTVKASDFSGFSETRVLIAANDMSPITDSILTDLENIQFKYEPRLIKRFKELVNELSRNK